MFKKLKSKVLEWIIKDLIKEVPTLKDRALELLKDKKDEILDKVKTVIKETILKAL